MELTILGGSAAAPNPGDASSGYLVTSDGTALLLDCGSGVVSRLREQVDVHALTAVVISHLHSDHTLDLVALRYALKYAPRPNGNDGDSAPIPLHLPPGGLDFLARLAAVFAVGSEAPENFWGEVFAPREYGPYLDSPEPLLIGLLALRFAPMAHYIPVWAIRIADERSGRVLTYSADTGPQGGLAAFAAGSDLLLCEATLLYQSIGQDPAHYGHLTAAEAGQIATKAGVAHLVLTHMWDELGFDRYLADAREAFAGPTDRARAGAVFEV
jgi:ribonuclease BN (tRNA processing enzyme)